MVEPSRDRKFTRAQVVCGAAAGTAASAGAVLFGGFPDVASSAPSAEQDASILRFVLQLEDLQAAYYEEVLRHGRLTGEPREYARTVLAHEREHAAFLRTKLGSKAKPAPKFDFGAAASDPKRFLATARRIEELGVMAYDAGAPNLTNGSLKAAARIVSVEARHAAWVRDLAGLEPAPAAAEPTQAPDRILQSIRATGFVTS